MDLQTEIDFIAGLPDYEEEKPYFLHPSAAADIDENFQTSNVQWDKQGVMVRDMRDKNLSLEHNGFCYVHHKSQHLPSIIKDIAATKRYSLECEDLLRSIFKAELVRSYDFKIRKNVPMELEAYDPEDPLLVEQAAVGAHDISIDRIPRLLKRLLDEEELKTFFRPGYRFRLINTWRSILPVCEDRPLALCDFNSVKASDLMATERIYPFFNQEIYFLKYNKDQEWYWLSDQRADEPLLFLTYDSHSGSNARYCPHVSVENPRLRPGAPPRESVETRNLVVTKEC